MTSRAQKLDNAKLIRALIGFGVGCVAAGVALGAAFWLPASWNGAIDRFSDAHPVLDVLLGVSVLFLGCLPVLWGTFCLVVPNLDARSSGVDGKPKGRDIVLHTSLREALVWIGVGCGYAALVGFVIYVAGR